MTALYDYRWAFSAITKAALLASSAYNIENFTRQSDQTAPVLGWKEPQRNKTLRPHPTRITIAADWTASPDGTWSFDWSLPPMTALQFAYITTNQFSSGTLWSGPATVQTWDENVNGYSVFQGTVLRPEPNVHYTIQDQMFVDVVYRFRGMTLL